LKAFFASVALAAVALPAAPDGPPLKSLMPPGLLIGAALNLAQVDGRDAAAQAIVVRHFDTISPENLFKWTSTEPEPGRFTFEAADRYVAFGEQHGMAVIGHTLVWHQQTPLWAFAGKDGRPLDRETALARLRAHIAAVAGRYKGRIRGWDVVNEAFENDGSWRQTPWFKAIGPDYVAQAFTFAHQADPQAELYYNDFDLYLPAKRAAVLALVKDLRGQGVRIDAVGEQGHWSLEKPGAAEIEAILDDITAAGVKAMITELDVDVLPRTPEMEHAPAARKAEWLKTTNLYPGELPAVQQQALARRYAEVFGLFLKHRAQLTRVTFWGVTDAQSWLNGFPIPGRTNHPLLWDRQGRGKPALPAVIEVLKAAPAR
jgi:endo-1,4-beta-xylanase